MLPEGRYIHLPTIAPRMAENAVSGQIKSPDCSGAGIISGGLCRMIDDVQCFIVAYFQYGAKAGLPVIAAAAVCIDN